jgi:membrane fusion protein (multidrug efflux system)
LLAIVASGSDHITASFKETSLKKIRLGQRATFTVDAYPNTTFPGWVESISPGTGAVFSLLPPENASGNFTKVVQRIPVRIAIDRSSHPELELRAGMSVVVTVDTG